MGFVKRIRKWGLIVKPNTKEGKWTFVQYAKFIFDHEVDAYKSALEMTSPGKYLYKPVIIEVSYEYEDEDVLPND